ncbi:MAG TPA: hypothetical protein VFU04_08395 [Solirubrobacterales bacterium]|nr:hypothetical protein [Solirubrobacterales bacterium]
MKPTPDQYEAAAIAAAIQRFEADTAAPPSTDQGDSGKPWQRAALLEGVGTRVTIEDLEGEGGARWQS